MRPFPNELALDSNLLLLLTVGTFEPRTLRNFKRLSSFTPEDLRLLQNLVSGRRLLVTPHLLTEVSNLANALPELLRAGFYRYLTRYIPTFTETYTEAKELCQDRTFPIFGLADTALSSLAIRTLIITEDGRLLDYLRRQGRSVMSLSDLRHLR